MKNNNYDFLGLGVVLSLITFKHDDEHKSNHLSLGVVLSLITFKRKS